MPHKSIKEKLVQLRKEPKFTMPLSIYYPGLDNEMVRVELSKIIDRSIFEIYSKIEQGLDRLMLLDILHNTMEKFKCFHLNDNDFIYIRQYLNRIILIVEWDCSPNDLQNLI
ncbi:DUF4844 domain-containing protein [Flavobacterium sp. WV_118_3]|jgi:hypothetical protein|uniref:DUF4844 domain-containing protein n=1 Tax=Flavobacterium sp. WV_118_3 TaxID=3151764 RepID=UPI0012D0658F|nr:DUF4844 domain-containing protein [Flavobacterium sp.]HRB72326.1 DUF4844 domain-containing protein [Flavobacterium sp.]